jgi:hypothetical protein
MVPLMTTYLLLGTIPYALPYPNRYCSPLQSSSSPTTLGKKNDIGFQVTQEALSSAPDLLRDYLTTAALLGMVCGVKVYPGTRIVL